MYQKDLDKLREKLDDIDSELSKLIVNRFKIVEQIGDIKSKYDIKIEDTIREKTVINHMKKGKSSKDIHILVEIFTKIFEISKKYQKR